MLKILYLGISKGKKITTSKSWLFKLNDYLKTQRKQKHRICNKDSKFLTVPVKERLKTRSRLAKTGPEVTFTGAEIN